MDVDAAAKLHICEGVQSSNILSFCVKKSYLSPGLFKNLFFPSRHCSSLILSDFFWDTTAGPPRGLKIAKCLFFGSIQESHFRSDLHVGCHPENFYIRFCPKTFLGVTIQMGKSGKKIGAKSQC